MVHRRLPILTLLLASLLAACAVPTQAPTGKPVAPLTKPKPSVLPSTGPGPSGGIDPGTGNGIVSNNGSNTLPTSAVGIISDNGASLIGKVKAPAGIIGNNGGTIISDNGASVISNNGGNYRLLTQAEEVPAAGVVVRLVDAEGKAIAGPDGKQLTAVTDAQGGYAFKGIRPGNNLVLMVDLGTGGAIRAIAPKQTEPERVVDLNLASTLSTSYILDQYVENQPERQATLDKLPADVEAATRQKVGDAFAKGTTALPETLTEERVVETVNALRKADAAVDQQLEEVKKLLVAAGLSDLGNGRSAQEMFFGSIGEAWQSPDGTLHVSAPYNRRIWKVDADNKVRAEVGTGVGGTATLTGKLGPESPLVSLRSTKVAPDGRVWISEFALGDDIDGGGKNGRISRLEPDGRMTEVSREFSGLAIAVPTGADEALVIDYKLTQFRLAVSACSLYSLKADGTRRLIGDYSAADIKRLGLLTKFQRSPDGGLLAVLGSGTSRELCRLAPNSPTITSVFSVPVSVSSVAIDTQGNLFMLANRPSRKLEVRKADGTIVTLIDKVPGGRGVTSGALRADGSAMVALGNIVFEARGGQLIHLAGSPTIGPGVKASEYILDNPTGLAVSAAGFFVADDSQNTLVKIGTDQFVSAFAGTGELGNYNFDGTDDGDGGPASAALLSSPSVMHTDAQGNIYIKETYRIRKIGTDGRISSPLKLEYSGFEEIVDFAVAPDGTLYYAESSNDGGGMTFNLKRLAPGASQPEVLQEFEYLFNMVLAVSPSGTLYCTYFDDLESETPTLARWTGTALETVGSHERFDPDGLEPGNMAIDAKGRVYVIDRKNVGTLQRFDPATGQWSVTAGVGGSHFNGATIDTSLDDPHFPRFAPNGDLYFVDTGHQQVKRIPGTEL